MTTLTEGPESCCDERCPGSYLGTTPIEMAALGRPLYPGTLYDCRRDSFISGVTLWDKEALREDVDVRWQPKTNLRFSSSDSLGEKNKLLDVSASLKAGLLMGLVEVGGAAKYLHDVRSSEKLARVTMQYSQTTRFEQFNMPKLAGKITYPQVFDQHTATHVVTGVLYGAQAFIVFDHEVAENENNKEVEGNLHAIAELLVCSTEGDITMRMNANEKKLAENISVTFHGDYKLDQNPTTYMEAIELYKELPHLLKDKESDAVPVRVWLYPLKLLNDKAPCVVREISDSLVSKAECLQEELEKIQRRCNDLIGSRRVHDFLDLKDRLQAFQELYRDYKTSLHKTLISVLPSIRDGTQEELVLTNILSTQYTTPFASNIVNQWLDDFTAEVNILNSYFSGLTDVRVVTSPSLLNAILFDPAVDVVVCLSFTSLEYKDPYLDALKKFVHSEAFVKLGHKHSKVYSLQATQRWFTVVETSKSMTESFSLFKSFSKANKTQNRIQFVIVSISDPTCPGVSVRLYEKGKLANPKFQPVSKPPPITVEIQNRDVILKLQKSLTGETVRFRVEYVMAAKQRENWESTETQDANGHFVLTGLQPGNQYFIRYRAVSVVGVSEASESVHVSVPSLFFTNECSVVGGTGGREFLFFSENARLRKIKVTLGKNTVDYLGVTLSNNQKNEYGRVKCQQFQEFTFEDGDRFRSLTLWPNKDNNRLGGLLFEIVRRSGQINTFSAKIGNVGHDVPISVHSGVCCGVKVRSWADVDALGFFFLK